MKKLMAMMLLATMTACDYAEKRDLRHERKSHAYQEAMADYQAGRLDSAVKGFLQVVRKDPSNSSARFQLACLLLDVRKDYQGAFCAFQEYLVQEPESDKAQMARERCDICAREMAKEMAVRYGLNSTKGLMAEIESLKRELKEIRTQKVTLERELEASQVRANGLAAEREKLLAMIRGEGTESAERPQIAGVKDLLDEEEDELSLKPSADPAELKSLKDEEEDVAKVEMPKPDKPSKPKPVVKEEPPPPSGPQLEEKPEFYTVQEGDTLIRIATRFYGRPLAWKKIREANKALISTDAKVRAGTVIRLP